MSDTRKPTNPKDLLGSDKMPLHLWPESASALGALALLDGALKYGRSNWRHSGVRASIYVDAARRHLGRWFEGQDADPDSGLPELAHVLACIAIIVDAQAAGMLVDDRQTPGGYPEHLSALTPHVARLKALHAGKDPKHYTIADAQPAEPEPPESAHDIADCRVQKLGSMLRELASNFDWKNELRAASLRPAPCGAPECREGCPILREYGHLCGPSMRTEAPHG